MFGRLGTARSGILAVVVSGTVLTVISLAYFSGMRRLVIPDSFAYLPKESNLIVATGGIEDLWNGIDYHLGSAIRAEGTEPGFLAEQVEELRRSLDDQLENLPGFQDQDRIRQAANLTRHGVDISRGLLLAAQLRGNDAEAISERASLLAVVPLRADGHDAFQRFLSALMDEDAEPHDCGLDRAADTLLMGDEPALLLAFPEPAIGVVSRSADTARACRLLQQAFAGDNLVHARGDDYIYAAARHHLERPLLSGAGALLFMRALPMDLSPVMNASAALNFEAERMIASVEIDLQNERARIVNEILAAPPAVEPWRQLLAANTGAVLELRDTAIPRYIDFASRNDDVEELLDESFGGILGYLDDVAGIRQLVVAALDYEEGLPKLALGIWADEDSLAALVRKLQRKLRDERDRAILRGAVRRFRQSVAGIDERSPLLTLAALRSGILCEDEPWFDRFTLEANGELRESRQLDDAIFDSAAYRGRSGSSSLYFLDPAVTANDFEFRLEDLDQCGCAAPESPGPAEAASGERACSLLLEGRYRLTAAIADGALWLTFGRRDLEHILGRQAGGTPAGDRAAGFSVGAAGSGRLRKGGLYANVPELVESGLLSGERDIREAIERFLFDLRDHPETGITLVNARGGERIRLILDARKAAPALEQ